MKKRTIFVVLLLLVLVGAAAFLLNWFSVRTTAVQAVKKQIRKDFLTEHIPENSGPIQSSAKDKFSVALVTDIHNNTKGINSAISQINASPAKFVIGLGDYTNIGTKEEFSPIQKSFKALEKKYYLLPGDHDLWNGRDKSDEAEHYFKEAFPQTLENFTTEGVKFMFIDNADIYQGVPAEALDQFMTELDEAKESTIIISTHKAIYHPLTIHRMGYINDQKNDEVFSQAEKLFDAIKKKQNAKIILLSGDLHTFSKYSLPSDKYEAYTIGALTETKNFQSPRFAVLHVSVNNEVRVEDVPIDP